MVFVMAQCR